MENTENKIVNIFDQLDTKSVDSNLNIDTTIKLKYEPRPIQIKIRDFFAESVKANKKFIMIEAPVGTGKSFAASMMMQWYKMNYDPTATFDVLTNSKILQEQYTRDFEYINSLWGKESYHCEQYNCNCSTSKQMQEIVKNSCDNCVYDAAKAAFFTGEVSLTNFHMFTTYQLFLPIAWKRNSRLLIIDEAHEYDNVFCDFITTKISKIQLKKSNVEEFVINDILSKANSVNTVDDYSILIKETVLEAVKFGRNQVKKIINSGALNDKELQKAIDQVNYIDNLIAKWEKFLSEFKENPTNWVLEKNEMDVTEISDKGKKYKIKEIETLVTPVWSSPYLDKMIWSKYDHIVLMSGTILDKNMFAEMNGIDSDKAAFISIPSPFPIENRPIYYIKSGKMNYKEKVATFETMLPTLKNIMKRHINDKGIIHTVNYELSNWVKDGLLDKRILVHESKNRQEVLDSHYVSKNPTVLCSPSMINGVDLKDDFSRFQVILKIPYPNMKSEKVKKRMETNSNWYSWKTICDLIQSYGRSIRSERDKADTYILDSCFSDITRYSSHLIPDYIKKAIIKVN